MTVSFRFFSFPQKKKRGRNKEFGFVCGIVLFCFVLMCTMSREYGDSVLPPSYNVQSVERAKRNNTKNDDQKG